MDHVDMELHVLEGYIQTYSYDRQDTWYQNSSGEARHLSLACSGLVPTEATALSRRHSLDVCYVSPNGNSTIHRQIVRGNLPMVEWLFAHGAPLEQARLGLVALQQGNLAAKKACSEGWWHAEQRITHWLAMYKQGDDNCKRVCVTLLGLQRKYPHILHKDLMRLVVSYVASTRRSHANYWCDNVTRKSKHIAK
jgi:hypothetical protein